MSRFKTIPIGTKIGRLVVLGPGDPALICGQRWATSVCECQCDNHTIVTLPNNRLLAKRPTLSCGCANKNKLHPRTYPHLPRVSKGHRYVYAPDSPGASKSVSYNGYVFEHRYVMEKHLGRPLRDDEVVHHIDQNPLNNDISNLMVLSNSDHAKVHHLIKSKLRSNTTQTIGNVAKYDVSTQEKIKHALCSIEKRKCIDCGKDLSVTETSSSGIVRCVECSHKLQRKVERPSKEQLEKDVSEFPYLDLEKRYGVSTAAIKKWMRAYGIPIPNRREHWITNKPFVMTENRILAAKRVSEKLKGRNAGALSPYAKKVVQLTLDGEIVKEYGSISDVERENEGFNASPISRVCKGKSPTYKGFIWRYK